MQGPVGALITLRVTTETLAGAARDLRGSQFEFRQLVERARNDMREESQQVRTTLDSINSALSTTSDAWTAYEAQFADVRESLDGVC